MWILFEKANDAAAINAAFGGRLHATKAADILNQLSKLLQEDEARGGQLLSASDRQVALAETRALLDALTAPDQSGVTTSWLAANPARQVNYDNSLRNASKALNQVSDLWPASPQDPVSDAGGGGPAADAGGAADAIGVIGLLPLVLQLLHQGVVGTACSMPGGSGLGAICQPPVWA